MALEPSDRYPGQVDVADPGYPLGKARNRSLPGDSDGTPWEEDLVNDIWGLLQSLLDQVGLAPSGTPDAVGASQYLKALRELRTESHIVNWRDDVHDSGAGAAAADRTRMLWSTLFSRLFAAATTSPYVRSASRALDWSTPGTPPTAAVFTFAESATRLVAGLTGAAWYTDDGDVWTACTGGAAYVHYDAAEAIFMAIDSDGDVETSADGETFASAGSVGVMSGQSIVNVRAVVNNGAGRWLACGLGDSGTGDAALVKTSDNAGATWEERSSPTEAGQSNGLLSVIWSERLGLFVACGSSWRIATSPNGADWTDRTRDVGTPGGYFASVIEVDELLVVTGTQGQLWASADGITWARRPTPSAINLHPSSLAGVVSSPYGIIGHAVNALLR